MHGGDKYMVRIYIISGQSIRPGSYTWSIGDIFSICHGPKFMDPFLFYEVGWGKELKEAKMVIMKNDTSGMLPAYLVNF